MERSKYEYRGKKKNDEHKPKKERYERNRMCGMYVRLCVHAGQSRMLLCWPLLRADRSL